MEIFLNIHYYRSQYFLFFDLEDVIFENFNISENNIISVTLAKVLRYIIFENNLDEFWGF